MSQKITLKCLQRPWIRNNVPRGQPAPGRINCPCGNAPESLYQRDQPNVICSCGAVYRWDGWIITPSPREVDI